MKIPNTLEESLNGDYAGLYSEVVTHDTYRLRQLDFVPDAVFDIGANVGIFARFARSLWPKAVILSLEPNPLNAAVYRRWMPPGNTTFLEAALGSKNRKLYHGTTARNGSGETYLTPGLGYPEAEMEFACQMKQGLEHCSIPVWSLSQIIPRHLQDDQVLKTVLKIDCEGAENCIWEDPEAMATLRSMTYICMEVHTYALNGSELAQVREVQESALKSLEETHHCQRDGVHFWARRK